MAVMSHKTVTNIKLLKSISSDFYCDSAYAAEHTKIKCHLSCIIYYNRVHKGYGK